MRAQIRSAQKFAHLPVLDTVDLGRPRLRVRNPIMAGYLEGITQALYDIYCVAANTATIKLTLFSLQEGSVYNFGGVAAFAKSRAHTNLVQSGMLEAPNKHITRAISVFTQSNMTTGDQSKFGVCSARFFVNQKSYQDTVVARLPGGGGTYAALAGTFTAPQGYAQTANGWPDTRNTYSLAYGGVPIEQQQNFQFVIDPTISGGGSAAPFTTDNTVSATVPVAGTGVNAWVFLDGTLFRAVQ
jgi:hypothetical protein